jgi:hypothetical protein
MLGFAKDIKMVDLMSADWYESWVQENRLAEIIEIKFYNEGSFTILYKEAPRFSEMTREEILELSKECSEHQMSLTLSKEGEIDNRLYFLHKRRIDRLGGIINECTNELIRRNEEGAK